MSSAHQPHPGIVEEVVQPAVAFLHSDEQTRELIEVPDIHCRCLGRPAGRPDLLGDLDTRARDIDDYHGDTPPGELAGELPADA